MQPNQSAPSASPAPPTRGPQQTAQPASSPATPNTTPLASQPLPAAMSSPASCITGKVGFPQKGTLSCDGQTIGFTAANGQTVFSSPLDSVTSISQPGTGSAIYITIGTQAYTVSFTNYFGKPAYWGGIAFLLIMLVVGLVIPDRFEYPISRIVRFSILAIVFAVAYGLIVPALSNKGERNNLGIWQQYLKQYYHGNITL